MNKHHLPRQSALFTLALALSLAAPARSETLADVLQADLLPGWQMSPGQQMAGFRFNLAAGWKTYWRSPGDAGIPPSFDWSGSENLKSVRLIWPTPSVFDTNGLQSIGYHDQLLLPVEVLAQDPNVPVNLRVRVTLGVCENICIPASVDLTATLAPPGAPDAEIEAALAAVPVSASAAGMGAVVCKVEPLPDGLRLTATMALPPVGPEETVVFESGIEGVWVAKSVTSRSAGTLESMTEMVHPSGKPFALDQSAVIVTILAGDRSVEMKGCPAP